MRMHLTSRGRSLEDCDFEAEEFSYEGTDYYVYGVVTVPAPESYAPESYAPSLDKDGEPEQGRAGEGASPRVTRIETYDLTKQEWVDAPEALARLKDDKAFHARLIDSFWDECAALAEKQDEDRYDRR